VLRARLAGQGASPGDRGCTTVTSPLCSIGVANLIKIDTSSSILRLEVVLWILCQGTVILSNSTY